MAGRGGVIKNPHHTPNKRWNGIVLPECSPDPSILRFSATLKWEQAHEPLHIDIDTKKVCGIGPGMVFANAIRKCVPGEIGLVPCAVGGTAIKEWARGEDLYENTVKRVKESVKGDENAEIKALLWFQGESDTSSEHDVEAYRLNMESLIHNVRQDLDLSSLPIIQVSSRNASKAYRKMVDSSYVGSSDEVTRLMDRVEHAFIKHFANGNHRKGMSTLRPTKKKERHRTTFLLGVFTGCAIALIAALIILIHARHILNSEGRTRYMENIFPLYSLFGYIVFHMLMYSVNTYLWRHFRINYPFIFGFKEGTELAYREVFLLSSGLSVLSLVAVLSNLDMEMDQRTKSFSALTESVPLGLIIFLLAITFCPFNIIYKSSRFCLIRSAFHTICAPLYKVHFLDSFLADQLTTQVQSFRCLEFYVCYYFWGDFLTRSNKCNDSGIYRTFYLIVAIIPYWIRLLQCARRLLEDKNTTQGLNGLKYISTIIAVILRTFSESRDGIVWKVLAVSSSSIATVYNTYWDFVMDWGLLVRNSRNPWLRDKLLVPYKSVYFFSMAVNVILRFAWMQSVLGIKDAPLLHKTALTAIVTCLEIFRRGIWNFFRLENEHLSNVGKFRALNSISLPFNYQDDDDD